MEPGSKSAHSDKEALIHMMIKWQEYIYLYNVINIIANQNIWSKDNKKALMQIFGCTYYNILEQLYFGCSINIIDTPNISEY
jgi:hypothetical protein